MYLIFNYLLLFVTSFTFTDSFRPEREKATTALSGVHRFSRCFSSVFCPALWRWGGGLGISTESWVPEKKGVEAGGSRGKKGMGVQFINACLVFTSNDCIYGVHTTRAVNLQTSSRPGNRHTVQRRRSAMGHWGTSPLPFFLETFP